MSRAISSSRPASIRVVHQVSPPVDNSLTLSPSRMPFFRNSPTAVLARRAWKGVMWMSSKTMTKVRPPWASALPTLVDTWGLGGGVAWGVAGSCTASKLVTAWGTPSSVSTKSLLLSPLSGVPFLSVTTASTVTSSIWVGKEGVASWGFSFSWEAPKPAQSSSNPATAGRRCRFIGLIAG